MKTKISIRLSSVLFAAGLLAAGFFASADNASAQTVLTTLIKDTFTNNTTNRKAGDSLNTRSPEVGSGSWIANSNYNNAVFSSTGTIVAASTAESRISTPALTGIVTLSADLVAGGDWASISFLTTASSTAAWGWTGNESPLRVRIQGSYYFLESYSNVGSGKALVEGGGLTKGTQYTIALSLDTETLGIKLLITDNSGASVVDTGWIGTSTSKLTITDLAAIKAVGFRLNSSSLTNGSLVDNFLLTTTTPNIPEPGSVAIIFGMASLLGLIALKRIIR